MNPIIFCTSRESNAIFCVVCCFYLHLSYYAIVGILGKLGFNFQKWSVCANQIRIINSICNRKIITLKWHLLAVIRLTLSKCSTFNVWCSIWMNPSGISGWAFAIISNNSHYVLWGPETHCMDIHQCANAWCVSIRYQAIICIKLISSRIGQLCRYAIELGFSQVNDGFRFLHWHFGIVLTFWHKRPFI